MLIAVAAFLCVIGYASAATSRAVSGVKVAPAPFYDDEPVMTVTFKTATSAPHGRLYFLSWATLAAGAANDDCAVLSNADPIGYKGGVNATVVAKLIPDHLFGGDAFCPGPSMIQIFTQPAKLNRHMVDSPPKAKDLAIYRFRILRQP